MTHLMLSAIVLVMSIYGFIYCYCHSGINQVYLGIYKGLVERCVVEVDTSGRYMVRPQFYVPLLDACFHEYLARELDPYCHDFTYEVISLTGTTLLNPDLSSKVKLSFTASLYSGDEISRQAVFAIERSNHE